MLVAALRGLRPGRQVTREERAGDMSSSIALQEPQREREQPLVKPSDEVKKGANTSITKAAGPSFREGDEVVLAEGEYRGTHGVFLRLKEDPKWADITESNGSVRSHPVEWLAHSTSAKADNMTREELLRQEIEKYKRKIATYQAIVAEWESELGAPSGPSVVAPPGEATNKKKAQDTANPPALTQKADGAPDDSNKTATETKAAPPGEATNEKNAKADGAPENSTKTATEAKVAPPGEATNEKKAQDSANPPALIQKADGAPEDSKKTATEAKSS
jgi:hypothetical protein